MVWSLMVVLDLLSFKVGWVPWTTAATDRVKRLNCMKSMFIAFHMTLRNQRAQHQVPASPPTI